MLTDPTGFRVRARIVMQRNATRCERAVRPRGSWNLGGSRVRLTASRICHLGGHLALERGAVCGKRARATCRGDRKLRTPPYWMEVLRDCVSRNTMRDFCKFERSSWLNFCSEIVFFVTRDSLV